MQPQQQTVVTAPTVQPMFVVQPYQTATVVSTYSHVQSMIIGIALIIIGALSILFGIVEMANLGIYGYSYAQGFWCGILVSIPFIESALSSKSLTLVFYVRQLC